MKLTISGLFSRLFATETVRVPVVDELPAAPAAVDEAALIQQIWDETRPPAGLLRVAHVPALPEPELTVEQLEQMRDGLAAMEPRPQLATGGPVSPGTSRLEDEMTRRCDMRPPASLGARLAGEPKLLPWPPVAPFLGGRPLVPVPQSDYVPTTPPPAPLPRGTATGPGFARTLERIDDVIAQEAAAKRYFDGLGDPA